MSLYQKYRPKIFSEMVGNVSVINSLSSFVESEERPHAYLFIGNSGCGKTTAARAFSASLHATTVEVNMGSNRGIDTIRSIQEELLYNHIDNVVWILDEAHSMTTEASNALLKMLEDTPEWAYFILCSTEPQKISTMIGNRCSQMSFKPLSPKNMFLLITSIAEKESIIIEDDEISEIQKVSGGIPRKAIVLLETIANVVGNKERIELIQEASHEVAENVDMIEFLRLVAFDSRWDRTASCLSKFKVEGQDPEKVRLALIGYLGSVLLSEKDAKKRQDIYARMKPFFTNAQNRFFNGFPALVFECFQSYISRGIPL